MGHRVVRTERRWVSLTHVGLAMSVIVIALAMGAGRAAAAPVGPATCTTESENVRRLEAQLAQHVRAVRNLGMPTTAQTAEQWQEITEEDREGARRYFFDGVQEASFALADGAVQQLGSLNPWNVNPVITRLRATGLSTPPIEAALRGIAGLPGKPLVRTGLKVKLKVLEVAVDGARWEARPTSLETKLEAIKMVLGWLPQGVQGGFVIGGADFIVSLIYSGRGQLVDRPAINRLVRVSEQQQRGLAQISMLMQRTVRELKTARQALKTCERRAPREAASGLAAQLQAAIAADRAACTGGWFATETAACIAADKKAWPVWEAYCRAIGNPLDGTLDNPMHIHFEGVPPSQYSRTCGKNLQR